MTTYITLNDDGSIAAAGAQGFQDSTAVDYEIVCGYDGKLYKAGEEPKGPSADDILFLQLRAKRDERLTATDKYLLPDYPISADDLTAIKAYRQALRDLPDQPGAPWDGGGDKTPWPELPKT